METAVPLEDTLDPAARAESVRTPSAATAMVETHAAFRNAEGPASVVEDLVGVDSGAEDSTAVVAAGVTNRSRDAPGCS